MTADCLLLTLRIPAQPAFYADGVDSAHTDHIHDFRYGASDLEHVHRFVHAVDYRPDNFCVGNYL
jgi:hypothetical protein